LNEGIKRREPCFNFMIEWLNSKKRPKDFILSGIVVVW
jgi:hypothetical protein